MSSEISNHINTATNTFNDQFSALENKISLPTSATQVNYTNVNNYITTLDSYLNTLIQVLLNLQKIISDLLTSPSCSTILLIFQADITYTKADKSTIS
jgi:hypothetical protein